jgi:hypothetical protein
MLHQMMSDHQAMVTTALGKELLGPTGQKTEWAPDPMQKREVLALARF